MCKCNLRKVEVIDSHDVKRALRAGVSMPFNSMRELDTLITKMRKVRGAKPTASDDISVGVEFSKINVVRFLRDPEIV